jgi:hypothetical protein
MRLLLKRFCAFAAGSLALFALLVAVVLAVFPSPIVEHKFATYDEAVAARAIENEWIPTLLPRSAKKISSVRNLDLNEEVVIFEYGPDFDQFIAAQTIAPARTAKDLGFARYRKHFRNLNELVYMPKVMLYRESNTGTLLINRVDRIALYFD